MCLAVALATALPCVARAESSPVQAPAGLIDPQELRRHIDVLASDAFGGRVPGTPAESQVVEYIVGAFEAAGLEPAGDAGGWLQSVPLVESRAGRARVSWRGPGASGESRRGEILLAAQPAPSASVTAAKLVLAGSGEALEIQPPPPAGETHPFEGAVVFFLAERLDEGDPTRTLRPRFEALREAGAAAAIAVDAGGRANWDTVAASFKAPRVLLDVGPGLLAGAVTRSGAERIFAAAGLDFDRLARDAAEAGRQPVTAPLHLSIRASSAVRRFRSSNIVGRLPGSGVRGTPPGRTGEHLLFMAHWDGVANCVGVRGDRLCNGAVDNASGVAGLIELARSLASGPPMRRSALFLATTAEESGLLGGRWYASHPVAPLSDLVAGLNFDTIAVAPPDRAVVILGRCKTDLDAVIAQAAGLQGRTVEPGDEFQPFFRRSDHYSLAEAGAPVLVATSAFSDEGRRAAYFGERYHKPSDEAQHGALELGGAAQDVALASIVARMLGEAAGRPRWLTPAERQSCEHAKSVPPEAPAR
jgi:hypothetical protein